MLPYGLNKILINLIKFGSYSTTKTSSEINKLLKSINKEQVKKIDQIKTQIKTSFINQFKSKKFDNPGKIEIVTICYVLFQIIFSLNIFYFIILGSFLITTNLSKNVVRLFVYCKKLI